MKGTISLLNEFYIKGNLNRLWQEAEPEYRTHMEAVLPQMGRAVGDVSAYLRQPLSPDCTFYYVPNWLDEYGKGKKKNYGVSEAYIILSPTNNASRLTELTRHEFLHTALFNARWENRAAIKAIEYLFQQVPQETKETYDTWNYFVEESLGRAITIRMTALYEPAWQSKQSTDLALRQYFLIEPFLEALKGFEASGETFDQYFPKIILAIPWQCALQGAHVAIAGVEGLSYSSSLQLAIH